MYRLLTPAAQLSFICKAALLLSSIVLMPPCFGTENVRVIKVHEVIGPASNDFITRQIEAAEQDGVELLVISLDTPGGLVESTRDIVSAILNSNVPVATWVSPDGARAASAGTYIVYASHIAAMAPVTNIGSATPIKMGGSLQVAVDESPETEPSDSSGSRQPDETGSDDPDNESPVALDRKIVNDMAKYIRGLAELRGRNAEWAEKSVREAANLTSREALEMNVIDFIAEDIESLIAQAGGRTIKLGAANKTPTSIRLSGNEIIEIEPDWRHKLISFISNPSVMSILLMLGIYGLIAEFYSPGIGIGGIGGTICLILAIFGMQGLPVNYVGLALLLLGIILMIAEAFIPSFGVLGVGGTIAFIVGAIFLMDTDIPAYQVSIPVIIGLASSSFLICTVVLGMALKARRRQVVSGTEAMINQTVPATEDFNDEGYGYVRVQGEIWRAHADRPITRGSQVTITGIDGLCLKVQPDPEQTITPAHNLHAAEEQ